MAVGVVALVLLIGGVMLAVVVPRQRARARHAADEAVLRAVAPTIAGTVTPQRHLVGRHCDHRVELWFDRIDPTAGSVTSDHTARYVDIVHLQVSAGGNTPWLVRSERLPSLTRAHGYRFVSQPGLTTFGRLAPLPGLIARPDPAVEARLEQAGLLAAIERLAPPSQAWLPRVRFSPDPRPAMAATLADVVARVGRALPDDLPDLDDKIGLAIDLPRADLGELTPPRLAAVLDAAVAIAELNARVDPTPG